MLLTEESLRDPGDISTYIGEHDNQANAERVLDRIEKVFESLAEHPLRGNCPKELLALGMRDSRQVFSSRTASSTVLPASVCMFTWWPTVGATCKPYWPGGFSLTNYH